ncbi:hypothetical protein AMTR_s00039p00221040 [Amborella trichopoda]|uniref:PGG domain-containing protein n=1 Tax=Amborella trichopoda TaxID=13333 RepID=U5D0X0_AMBTC|nr:hypothetical protein AMTR_s00039p00221040 [Amborella trichopoda]
MGIFALFLFFIEIIGDILRHLSARFHGRLQTRTTIVLNPPNYTTSYPPTQLLLSAPPLLHMHQHQQQHYHLYPTFVSSSTINFNSFYFYHSRSSWGQTLPLYVEQGTVKQKESHWISGKTIAKITLTAAIQLISSHYEHQNGSNDGTSKSANDGISKIANQWRSAFINSFVICMVVAFAASVVQKDFGRRFPVGGKLLAEMASACLTLAFGLAMWAVLPARFWCVLLISLIPLLASLHHVLLVLKHKDRNCGH